MVHIIGHSLGGQAAGFVGKYIKKMTNGKQIARITGLDPARPLFETYVNNPSKHLDKSDAQFVDIVHTDGGVFGFSSAIGTVDFFPNGGKRHQPGCSPTSAIKNVLEGVDILGLIQREGDILRKSSDVFGIQNYSKTVFIT